jgi:hypothetical protein
MRVACTGMGPPTACSGKARVMAPAQTEMTSNILTTEILPS